jgi:hypothetical protein
VTLPAIILAVAALLHRGTPSPDVVAAIASVSDSPETAALLTVYSGHESSYRPGAVGDAGRSCGLVQLRCEWVRGLTIRQQLALWLRLVRASSLASVDSSAKRAAYRERLSRHLLAMAMPLAGE